MQKLPDDPTSLRYLDAARESAERGAALTKRLLAFARRQELHPEPVELDALIGGLVDMLRRSVGPTIRIDLDIEPGLDLIRADPNQLELAILNLALNARLAPGPLQGQTRAWVLELPSTSRYDAYAVRI